MPESDLAGAVHRHRAKGPHPGHRRRRGHPREPGALCSAWKATAVDLAPNGAEGLRQLEARDYDLVLLDLMMPDRSGMDVLRDIRERDRETPVFMITAYRLDRTLAVEALKCGADDFIQKPWKNEQAADRDRPGHREAPPARRENTQLKRASSSATASPTSSAGATACCASSTWSRRWRPAARPS